VTNTSLMVTYFGALSAITLITLAAATLGKSALNPSPDSKAGKTLANLQAAYNGESNARARYLAFARRADREGYRQVASLFRAAARAEQIHLTNHAEVVRKMGAEPHAMIDMPVVKSTKENLEAAANKGEAYERDTMYPNFITQAEAEDNEDAMRTFELARNAEAQHFRLFTEALNSLEKMKGAAGHTYYACNVCGYTTAERPTGNCVSCASPSESYEAIS
jgi:rubrerythrin